MKTLAIIAAAALQVAALAYMAGEREWVLRTGRVVYLRTTPMSPQDAMRGDYVQLNYEIAQVPVSLCRDGLAGRRLAPGAVPLDTRVYASLRENEDGLAEIVSLSDRRPGGGLFLRGYADRPWEWGGGSWRRVRYGIEAWFMQQGKSAKLEEASWRKGAEVPLEMEVAVSPSGLGVLKGYRWARLGIGLDLDFPPQKDAAENGRRGLPRAATIRLLNAGDKDLAVVDLPGGRSLGLAPDQQWTENPWRWVHEGEAQPQPAPQDVIVLKPGQAHKIRLDFKDPVWSVVKGGTPRSAKAGPKPLSQATDDYSATFRFEYRPPDRAACKGLPNADLIWHGRLPTSTFCTYRVD